MSTFEGHAKASFHSGQKSRRRPCRGSSEVPTLCQSAYSRGTNLPAAVSRVSPYESVPRSFCFAKRHRSRALAAAARARIPVPTCLPAHVYRCILHPRVAPPSLDASAMHYALHSGKSLVFPCQGYFWRILSRLITQRFEKTLALIVALTLRLAFLISRLIHQRLGRIDGARNWISLP